MILLFRNITGNNFLIGFSRTKGLSLAFKISNFVFTPLNELKNFTDWSSNDELYYKKVNRIIFSFKKDDNVKKYLINEMSKLGFDFIEELKPNDYVKRWLLNEFI